MPPKVTVITPFLNSGRWLKECIESVLAQTEEDWEMVLVDDGSTDDSMARIEPFLKDARVRLIRPKEGHQGSPAARNTAARAGSGKWISWLDSDDVWAPKRLENTLRLLESKGDCDLCYSTGFDMREDGKVFRTRSLEYFPHEKFLVRLLDHNFIPSGSLSFSRRCFDELGGLDEASLGVEDYDFTLRAAMRYKFCALDEPLTYFRYHDRNLSSDMRIFESRFRLARKLAELRPDLSGPIRKHSAKVHFSCGLAHLERGEPTAARASLRESIGADLWSPWPYYLWLKTFWPRR